MGSFYLTLIFVLIFYFRPYSLKLPKPIPLESPQTRPFTTFSPLPQTISVRTIGEVAKTWNTTVWKSLQHMILRKLPLNFTCTTVYRMVRRTRRISPDCPINYPIWLCYMKCPIPRGGTWTLYLPQRSRRLSTTWLWIIPNPTMRRILRGNKESDEFTIMLVFLMGFSYFESKNQIIFSIIWNISNT